MFGKRTNGGEHGVIFTKNIVVAAMLDLVGYTEDRDLRNIKIIEPAAGEGAFAIEITKRLMASSKVHHFSFKDAVKNLFFFEINKEKALVLKAKIAKLLESEGYIDCVVEVAIKDFLLADCSKADLIIGNPPYVRWDNIPEILKNQYKKRYTTFNRRSDIFIPFYEKGLSLLRKDGQLCYICSNRWFKSQYGKSLRRLVSSQYQVDYIIDLEETDPFEEKVIAYPAITIISERSSPHKTKFYHLKSIEELSNIAVGDKLESKEIAIRPGDARWLADLQIQDYNLKYFDSIENQGFKIGIGVATGNDKIFIGDDLKEKIEPELLLPIITSKDLKNNAFVKSNKYIVNPFTPKGELIDLEKYPKAYKYFSYHRTQLEKRHIAKKKPEFWYRTIDKIHIGLLQKPKILLPDITGNKYIFIDRGEFYPHHNLYYITGGYEDLKLLAAILTSRLVYNQLIAIGNKMNGGYPRWQSQNLRKLRIPKIRNLQETFRQELLAAYEAKAVEKIDALINLDRIKANFIEIGQMKLFEPNVAKEYRSPL